MRALVVYCHPSATSFTAAVRDTVVDRLTACGAEVRQHDLYAMGFDPVLSQAEWAGYAEAPANQAPVAQEVADLLWCDTLIFVYPTWWYGMPALLKGWLDRVLLPEVAFLMPRAEGQGIRPGLTQVQRLGVFSTCGAGWWLTRWVGAPGRRTLLRGVRLLLARRARSTFAALYLIDGTDQAARQRHLLRVAAKIDRLVAGART